MAIIAGIILMGFFSFVLADPPSQQDYGLCSQVYIMHQYCTSQLSPASTAVSQRPLVQPRVGKAGPRGPRGIVNYTAIDKKIAGKFTGWEAEMEEKFKTLKSSADNEMKNMKVGIENKTKEYEASMQENFTRWKNSAESLMGQMGTNLTNKGNDMEESIEGKFTRWRVQAESKMRVIKADIANKTNEWQGMKDKLVEQNSSINSEMNNMRIAFTNKTKELEKSVRQNFTRWRNSAESEMNEMKANLIRKEHELEASVQENFTRWKSSAELEMIAMKADLVRKDEEIRSFKKSLLPSNCGEFGAVTEGSGGVANIFPNGKRYQVYCDMTTDGGNWTVFQRRMDGSVDFYRIWEEYASGFGNKWGEFWLGLETIYQLTRGGRYELRVDLTDWDGSTRYALYRTFSISGRSDGYRLTVGRYSGTAGDAMNYHNGQRFSAKDQDLDSRSSENCATRAHSSWWFVNCAHSSLNGRYNDTSNWESGLYWNHWRGGSYSLKGSEMKFRKK